MLIPLPTLFPKAIFLRVVKGRGHVIKELKGKISADSAVIETKE